MAFKKIRAFQDNAPERRALREEVDSRFSRARLYRYANNLGLAGVPIVGAAVGEILQGHTNSGIDLLFGGNAIFFAGYVSNHLYEGLLKAVRRN